MPPKKYTIRTTFSLFCFTFEGIEAIKAALLEAKAKTSDDEFPMDFKLATPHYKVEVVSKDKKGAFKRVNQALELIQKGIEKRGGTFKLICLPQTLGNKQDD